MSLLRADKLANQENNSGPIIVGPSTVSGDFIITNQATILGLAVTNSVNVGAAVTSRHLTATNTANLFQTVLTGVTTAGIVTQATYYGDGVNLSGVVTSIKAGSNISVNNSTGEVTISASGNMVVDDIEADTLVVSGITTLGIVTGATYYGDGSNLTGVANTSNVRSNTVVVTGVSTLGVVTGATYYGDGSNLTGVANTSNVITNTLVVSGVATFQSDVYIEGELTYEDVDNIDSVGMITARSGIQILSGGLDVVGVTTLQTVEAGSYFGNGANLTGIVTTIIAGTNITIDPVGGTGAVTINSNAGNLNANTLVVSGVSTLGVVTGVTSIESTEYYGDGSNLTGITHTQVGAMGNLADDTTPQLGGNLDINNKYITGTGGVDITGVITATSFTGNLVGDVTGDLTGNATTATDATNATNIEVDSNSNSTFRNVVFVNGTDGNLKPQINTSIQVQPSTGILTATKISGDGSLLTGITHTQVGAIGDLVDDTTPQLGGNLDVNGNDITGTGDINLTGTITATSFSGDGSTLSGIVTHIIAGNNITLSPGSGVGEVTINSSGGSGPGNNLNANTLVVSGFSTLGGASFSSGVNVTGIVTASSFVGDISGTATNCSRSVVAGDGLTGGGSLTANRTLNVGAGDGITVGEDAVAVDSTVVRTTGAQTISGTKTFSNTISGSIDGNANTANSATSATTATNCTRSIGAGNGLTGGGSLNANRTLNVVGGDGITANANDIEVDNTVVRTTGNQSIGGTKTFTSTISGDINGNANTATTATSAGTATNCSRSVVAGNGLTGGGSLTANRILDVVGGSGISVTGDAVAVNSTVVRTSGNQTIGGTKTFTSPIKLNDGVELIFGTGSDSHLQFSGSNTILDLVAGNYLIRDISGSAVTRHTFFRNGNYTATGTVTANAFSGDGSSITNITATNATNCSRSVVAGNGLTGGGVLNANRTLNVVGGDGITANANDIEVDNTVVRTSGAQTIGGTKTFSNNIVGTLSGTATNANNINVSPNSSTNSRYLIFTNGTSGNLGAQAISTILVNPSAGRIQATIFQGSGANLTNLNASQLSSGTVPSARLSNVNATTLTVTGTNSNVNYRVMLTDGTGNKSAFSDGGLLYNASTNVITASGGFSGDGSALTSLNATAISDGVIDNLYLPGTIFSDITGTATNATNVNLRSRNTNNATHYVTFGTGTSGNQRINTDSNLTYNPFTNTLTVANLTGVASGLKANGNGANSSFPIVVVNGTTPLTSSGGATINVGTGKITAVKFQGDGSSLTSLPAGQLTGTIADARLPNSISSDITGNAATSTQVQCNLSTDQSVNVLFANNATSGKKSPIFSSLITGNLNSGRINVAQFKVSDLAGSGNRAVYSNQNGILTNSSSDETLKTNVTSMSTQYNIVKQLNPVTYNWIDTENLGTQQEIGFIAQQMQTHVPQVIGTNNDDTLTIDYPKLTAVLTKALQEAITKIENLEARLDAASL